MRENQRNNIVTKENKKESAEIKGINQDAPLYSYEEVIRRIENSRRFGNLPGIEVSRRALESLGHPEAGMRYVHVAGTNGKGSVCAFLSSILEKGGKRVGTFTSPHLIHFEERIMINGRCIPKEDVKRLGNRLLALDFGVTLTMFDYCLLMAVLYFKEQKCDIAVIETGLGGRLDSTNALGTPEVAVITRIGYDHTAILGNTLREIASEKAGIIKKGSILVMERQEREAEQVLREKAKEVQVRQLYPVNAEILEKVNKIKLRLPGVHQRENAAAAMLAAAGILTWDHAVDKTGKNSMDYALNNIPPDMDAVIRAGLEAAVWPGRMEILSSQPFLMVDGAHNGHGVAALCASLKDMYPGEKFHFLMGVMADKDYGNMIEEMLPLALDFQTYTPESSRALQAERLAEDIGRCGIKASVAGNLEETLVNLPSDARTIAFGSLYFIGEMKAVYENLSMSRL